MILPAANGFQYALETTGPAGLAILAALGLASALTWSLLITRWAVVRKARRKNEEYLKAYRESRRPLDLYTRGTELLGTPLFSVYTAGARELCLQIFGTSEKDESFPVRLQNAGRIAPTQMNSVVVAMDRAVNEMALRLEEGMPLLAACVVTAPSLGLLGAVWGVMDTFAGLASVRGTFTLQDMAPGVSGALASAAIGLLVGIPALFGHNFLVRAIRTMVRHLDLHAAEFGAAIERHHVSHGLTGEKRPSLAEHAPKHPKANDALTETSPSAKPRSVSAPAGGEPRADPAPDPAPPGKPQPSLQAATQPVTESDIASRARPMRPPGPMFPGQTRLPFEDDQP